MRYIDIPVEVDFMAVASYGSATDSSGVVRILKDLDAAIQGRDVLIVEDIVDSGLTLQYLMRNLGSRNPAHAGGLRAAGEAKRGARSAEAGETLAIGEYPRFDQPPRYIGFEIRGPLRGRLRARTTPSATATFRSSRRHGEASIAPAFSSRV